MFAIPFLATIKLDVGRPVRLTLSKKKFSQIEHVIRVLHNSKAFASWLGETPNSLQESHLPSKSQENNLSEEHHIEIRKYLIYLNTLDVSTSQIVFNYELRKNKESCAQLVSSVQALNLSMSVSRKKSTLSVDLSRVIDISHDEQVSEITLKTCVRELQLKTSQNSSKSLTCIKPFTFTTDVKLVWMPWSARPYTESTINSEIFDMDFGPEHIFCFQSFQEYFQSPSTRSLPTDVTHKTVFPCRKSSPPLHSSDGSTDAVYQDDLRAGVFQYIKNATHTKPKPYQILFDNSSGTMIWRYPEPRALTRVDIFPVPFVDASDLPAHCSTGKQSKVSCVLQFYDSLCDDFVTYRQFQLSESELCQLELPSLYEKQHVAVAATWRVWINYSDDDSEKRCQGHLLVPATALAACIRVDSIFSVSLLPQHQLYFTINKIEVALQNHLKLCGKMFPTELNKFQVTQEVPDEHEFLAVQINTPKIRAYTWASSVFVQLSGSFGVEALNYAFLTNNVLLEPSSATVKMTAHESLSLDKPRCVDLQVFVRPVFLHVFQSTVHTLSLAQQTWEQAFDTSASKKGNKIR